MTSNTNTNTNTNTNKQKYIFEEFAPYTDVLEKPKKKPPIIEVFASSLKEAAEIARPGSTGDASYDYIERVDYPSAANCLGINGEGSLIGGGSFVVYLADPDLRREECLEWWDAKEDAAMKKLAEAKKAHKWWVKDSHGRYSWFVDTEKEAKSHYFSCLSAMSYSDGVGCGPYEPDYGQFE